jgi:hypothetical protein
MSPIYKVVIPFRDLLIALSFSYLYYNQGMKKRREEAVTSDTNKEDIIQSLNYEQLALSTVESNNLHNSVTHNFEEK